MSTAAPELPRQARASMGLKIDPWNVAIWLMATIIGWFFALVDRDATVIDGAFFPRGNDSFYHARRILDAAIGDRGFYQFDDRLQVPDGAWIPWPWGYDYLMAKALELATWLDPAIDPMAFISYVPVAWLAINAALFLVAATALGLSREMRLLAMLCFALSPLTQLLHVIGMVDHHYIEHTFVLLAAWLGLRWLSAPDAPARAAHLAVALGVAAAFHSGLFVLQLVPLATLFLLWLKHELPPARSLYAFSVALPVATLLVAIPAEPFRRGMFEFGLLSWFHVYVACCTAIALAFMAWRRCDLRRLAELAVLCGVLALPLGAQLLSGAGFLSGRFSILESIVEVQSPFRLFTEVLGPKETAGYYTWLLFAAPPLLVYYAWQAFVARSAPRVYFAVFTVFGLAFFLAQFRFHYYGFFALIAGVLLIADELRQRRQWHRGATFVAVFAAIVALYQPALRERLFVIYSPGADSEYASAISIFLGLRTLCASDPGTVLASPDDGSAILFHSECSVIANNFILRPEDAQHIDEIKRLMLLSPQEIRQQRPDIKYILVRVRDFSVLRGDTVYIVDENRVAKSLFIDPAPPEGFTLVQTVRRRIGADQRPGVYARLYKIDPLDAASPATDSR